MNSKKKNQQSNFILGNPLQDSFTEVHVLKSHHYNSSSLDLFRTIDISVRDVLNYLQNI